VKRTESKWEKVRARVRSCGICGGQSGTGVGFLQVLRFPLPVFIPPIAPQAPSSVIWDWYNRPIIAAVPSALSLTPLRLIKKVQEGRIMKGENIWEENRRNNYNKRKKKKERGSGKTE
jgi:hypothetical protein